MKTVFPDIIGNEHIKKTVGHDLQIKKQSHAYIIEGNDFSGRFTVAKNISKALMCEGDSDTFPCCKCRNCRSVEQGLCTDIYTLEPEEGKTFISVDSVKEMLRTITYRPDNSPYKVYIIKKADFMTVQAQNTLLISLEEPPEFVVFLLIVNNSKSLLETVRSRSTLIKTEKFTSSFVADWLKSTEAGAGADASKIKQAVAMSEGALGAALNVLTGNGKKLEMAEATEKFVTVLCGKSRTNAILYFSTLKFPRDELLTLLRYAESAIGDLLSLKSGCNTLSFFADATVAEKLSSTTKLSKLHTVYEAIISAENDINSNVSPSIVLTTLAGYAK